MLFKSLSSISAALLFSYSLFAQDNRPVLSALPSTQKPPVEIIYSQEEKPLNAKKIGQLNLKSGGIHCGIAGLLENAQYEATLKGGDAIYITNISAPAPSEYCYTLEAEIYKLKEPYTSKPNLDYPFENVITSKADSTTVIEILPQFPGGSKGMLNFIRTNLRYPDSAFMNNVSGKVTVVCVIDPTGKLTEISVVEGVRYDLDQEAVRVISQMPEWSPGFQNGKAVPVRYTIPIRFGIQGKAARKKKAE